MSAHVEWFRYDPRDPMVSVRAAEPGEEMPDGQEVEAPAIVLSADDVIVIEGDLEAFLEAVRQAVTNPDGEGWQV